MADTEPVVRTGRGHWWEEVAFLARCLCTDAQAGLERQMSFWWSLFCPLPDTQGTKGTFLIGS